MGIVGPGVVSVVGMSFQLAPVFIGVTATLLVRIPLMKPKSPSIVTEATLTLLAMLGAFVTIADQNIGPGLAFWTGIGFGAMGSTMIEIAKSAMVGELAARFKASGRAFFSSKESNNDDAG